MFSDCNCHREKKFVFVHDMAMNSFRRAPVRIVWTKLELESGKQHRLYFEKSAKMFMFGKVYVRNSLCFKVDKGPSINSLGSEKGFSRGRQMSKEGYWGRSKGVAGRDAMVAQWLRSSSVVLNYCATSAQ